MNSIVSLVHKGDVGLFYLVNKKITNQFLDRVMILVTCLGSTSFSIGISLFMSIYFYKWTTNLGFFLSINLLIGLIIVQIIKRLVNRPRPYISLNSVVPIYPPSCKYSFPSGHTCASFSIAYTLSMIYPFYSWLFLVLASLVAISRIYLGVHYPTDIVIGIIIATISTKIVTLLYL